MEANSLLLDAFVQEERQSDITSLIEKYGARRFRQPVPDVPTRAMGNFIKIARLHGKFRSGAAASVG